MSQRGAPKKPAAERQTWQLKSYTTKELYDAVHKAVGGGSVSRWLAEAARMRLRREAGIRETLIFGRPEGGER